MVGRLGLRHITLNFTGSTQATTLSTPRAAGPSDTAERRSHRQGHSATVRGPPQPKNEDASAEEVRAGRRVTLPTHHRPQGGSGPSAELPKSGVVRADHRRTVDGVRSGFHSHLPVVLAPLIRDAPECPMPTPVAN
jgi:hypothetical protein